MGREGGCSSLPALARLLCFAMSSMQASSSLRNAMQSTTRRISRCVKSVSVSCTVSNEWQARRRQGRVVDVYLMLTSVECARHETSDLSVQRRSVERKNQSQSPDHDYCSITMCLWKRWRKSEKRNKTRCRRELGEEKRRCLLVGDPQA